MRRRENHRSVRWTLAVVAAALTLAAERGAVAQSDSTYEQTVEWLERKLGNYHEVDYYYDKSDGGLKSNSRYIRMEFLKEPGNIRMVAKHIRGSSWFYEFFLYETEIKTDIRNTSPRIIFECIDANCINLEGKKKVNGIDLPFGVDCGEISKSRWRRYGPDYTNNADRCISGKSDPKEVRYRDRIAKALRHLQSMSPKDDLF